MKKITNSMTSDHNSKPILWIALTENQFVSSAANGDGPPFPESTIPRVRHSQPPSLSAYS